MSAAPDHPAKGSAPGSLSREEQEAEELLADIAAAPLAGIPRPSSREAAAYPRLTVPVVVPRIHGSATVPFARGYAPCLGDGHGIEAPMFMAFIDGLNLVTSPHPLTLLLAVGAFAMNFVPLDYADGLGAVMALLAEVSAHIIAKRRAKAYLERANALLFAPRGLHACIVNNKKLRATLGIPAKDPLLAPLSEETLTMGTLERCVHHLAMNGWAAAVDLEERIGRLMPMAKPTYRSADPSAGWHPDYAAASASGASGPEPSPLAHIGRSVTHGLAVVADMRVRWEIRKASHGAARSRRRAWKRHQKGKTLKEPFGEKFHVRQLRWILIRNLDDVQREEAEKAAAAAAKQAEKTAKKGRRRRASKKAEKQAAPAVAEEVPAQREKAPIQSEKRPVVSIQPEKAEADDKEAKVSAMAGKAGDGRGGKKRKDDRDDKDGKRAAFAEVAADMPMAKAVEAA